MGIVLPVYWSRFKAERPSSGVHSGVENPDLLTLYVVQSCRYENVCKCYNDLFLVLGISCFLTASDITEIVGAEIINKIDTTWKSFKSKNFVQNNSRLKR